MQPDDTGPSEPARAVLDLLEPAGEVRARPEPGPGQLGGRRYVGDRPGQPRRHGRGGRVQLDEQADRAGSGMLPGERQGEPDLRRGAVARQQRDTAPGPQIRRAVAVGPHGDLTALGEREDGHVVIEGEDDLPGGVAGQRRPGGDHGQGGVLLPGGEAQHGGGGAGGARRFEAEQPQYGDHERVRHLVEPVQPMFEEVGEEFEEGDTGVDGRVQRPDAVGLGGDPAADGRHHVGPGEVVQLRRGQGHGVPPVRPVSPV
ncbi:hypothetical protein [Streptomyces malaysiensis]|uniref:Uncharacterized protein n=1 Tax=Streptomyces malaysiensis subsp. samsunensis TaxID=459658 RepID=A0A9X2LSW7_STRMQ|nr:hypothetical protein [Streptomyces samsunensis]MCQ8828984.1 hypothetical protein [Streptomyces samsunensis]